MKTAISIPNPLFEAAEAFARERGVSRSELYATAVAEYLELHAHHQVKERLDAVYAVERGGLDEGVAAMQRRSVAEDDEAW